MSVVDTVPYFAYSRAGEWVAPGDASWSLDEFNTAELRGRRLTPTADRVVLLLDAPPSRIGGIDLPPDVHVSIECQATVVAVPRNKPAVKAGRLKGGVVTADKLGDYVEIEMELTPGMRVLLLRFAGWNSVPTGHTTLGHDRLRTVSYLELWCVVE
jgi:hypothetical protein